MLKSALKIALILVVGVSFFLQCKYSGSPTEENPAYMTDTSYVRPVIYQVLPRLFGNVETSNVPWGSIEQNGCGKFRDFSDTALSEIRKMGFTHIWYTGVLEHATMSDYRDYGIPLDDADIVKGRAGSPYAIKDYYDVSPDLAVSVPDRLMEFDALITRTHSHGLKAIIDFVPNHVARAYQSDQAPEATADLGAGDQKNLSFHPSNNFYYLPGESFIVPTGYRDLSVVPHPLKDGKYQEIPAKASGNDVFSATPTVDDWFETIKLNYGVDYLSGKKTYFDPIPDTWLKMKNILLYWSAKGVDGFRCDMAEMIPVEFWMWVIPAVKEQYPEMIFIAESYRPHLYNQYLNAGFNYLYDKVQLYDTLRNIVQGRTNTDSITSVWQSQQGYQHRLLRFIENHDEQRIASPQFAENMNAGIPLMATAAFMSTGPIMLYFGQEVGEPGTGETGFSSDDGRTTIYDYWSMPEFRKWVNHHRYDGGMLSLEQKELRKQYIRLLKYCNELEELRIGEFYDLQYFNRNESYTGYSDHVYTFIRHTEEKALLITINFSKTMERLRLKIPGDALGKFDGTRDRLILHNLESGRKIWVEKAGITAYDIPSGLILDLQPLSYEIFRIN